MAAHFTPSFIQIASFFTVAQVTLLFAAAVFLFAVQPRSSAKTLLALYFGVYAAGSLGGVLAWTFSPDDFTPAPLSYFDFLAPGALVFIAFAWLYPVRARVASLPGALLILATVLQAAYAVAYFTTREAWMASAYGASATAWIRSVAFVLAAIACLLRFPALAPPERRVANLVLFAGVGGVLTVTTTNVVYGLASLRAGGSYLAPILLTDASRLALVDHLVLSYVAAPALAILWWRRERTPLVPAMVAYGVALGIIALTPAGMLGSVMIIQALAALYALVQGRAFGVARAPPGAALLVAILAGGAVFMVSLSVVLAAFGESSLTLASAILLGLVLGALAFFFGMPRDALPLRDATDESTRRLAAYTVALDRELRAGRSADEARASLADLRAALRVSDEEHAAVVGGRAGDGLVLGRYRPLRILGEGGSGETRLCHDERVGRQVVVKRIRGEGAGEERLQAVLREARAIGSIKHPNVVTLHDVAHAGHEAVIVMEHAERGSLRDTLAAGPLDAREWRRVADGLLQALEAVHAAGIVHRDVKPSNVLLDAAGEPKLADFGIARVPGFETTVGGLREGAVGTFRYMSPEQAKGRPATARSDLFSAAATLYEARTGRPYLEPRAGESAVEVQLRAASAGAFERVVEPPPLRAWFARALDPEPGARFASAREMRDALPTMLA